VVVDSLHKEIGSVRTASPAAVAVAAAAAAAVWCPLLQNGPAATVHKKKQHGGTKPMWAKSTFASARAALPEEACVWMESDDGGGHTTTGGSRRLQDMEAMVLPPYLQGADTTPRTTSEVIFRTGASTTTTTTVATVTPVITATPGSPASPLAHHRRLGQTHQASSFPPSLSSITTSRATSSPSLSSSSSSISSSPSSSSSSSSPSSSSSSPYREKQSRARTAIHSRTLQSTPATRAAFDGDNANGVQVDGGGSGGGGGGGGGRDTGFHLVQGANNGAAVNVITGSSPSSADSNTPSEASNRGDQVYESGQSVRAHRQQHHNNSEQAFTASTQSGFTRDGEWVTGQDHERHRALGMIVGCEDGFHFHPLDTHCPHERRVPTLAGEDDSETELDCISPGVTVRVTPPGFATASITMMSRTLPSLTPPLWSVNGEQRTTVPVVLPAGSTMMSRAFPTLPATPLDNEPIAHQIRRIQMPLIEQLQRQYDEQIERQRSLLEQSQLEAEEEEVEAEGEEQFTASLPDSSHPMLAASVPMSRQPALGGWRHVQRQVSSLQPQPSVVPQQSTPHPFESTSSPSSSFSSAVVPESHQLQGSNTLYLDYEGGVLRPQERWRRSDNEMLGR